MWEFTPSVLLVVDAFSGKFSVAKALMPLLKHRTFIVCKEVLSCVTDTVNQSFLRNAYGILHKKSNRDEDEHICSSSKVHFNAVEAIWVGKRLGMR